MTAQCTCSPVKVGGQVTGAINWQPDCPEHGTSSTWYNSPAQSDIRAIENIKTRELQVEARRVRNGGTPDPERVKRILAGESPQ